MARLSYVGANQGRGVQEGYRQAAGERGRLAEHAELAKDECAVVIDPFAGQAVVIVEGEHTAQRQPDGATRGRKSAPGAEMSAANLHFEHDGVVRDMTVSDVDRKIR